MTYFLSSKGTGLYYNIFIGFGRLCFRTRFRITHSAYILLLLLLSLLLLLLLLLLLSLLLLPSDLNLGLSAGLRWSSFLYYLTSSSRWQKELHLRSCGTPVSTSVKYNYILGETSITSFCSDFRYSLIYNLVVRFILYAFTASCKSTY